MCRTARLVPCARGAPLRGEVSWHAVRISGGTKGEFKEHAYQPAELDEVIARFWQDAPSTLKLCRGEVVHLHALG